jgi:hypothetical protein
VDDQALLPSPREVKDFIYLKNDDFPPERYPKKDTSGRPPLEMLKYLDEDQIPEIGKEQYTLLSKIKKRHRFELIKNFRYIGLNMVPVPLDKIAAMEE